MAIRGSRGLVSWVKNLWSLSIFRATIGRARVSIRTCARSARDIYNKVFTHSRGMTITGCAGRPLNN